MTRWSMKITKAEANDNQSTGSEIRDPPDIGCEFLENRRGSITNPHATEKNTAETT